MCLGYLKLAQYDEQLKQFIMEKKHLTTVIEEWL